MALTEQFLLVEYVAWGYPARSTARLECADRQKITARMECVAQQKISARYGIAARGRAGGALQPARNQPPENGLIKLQNTLLQ
jgi:hypothetical protein